ncbi:hypothetical protein BYT27DRAFT_7248428 [Phlegmacium glaucopus]|nr:hypothetical protein BYT27DRAFT_7248428 [Phlegmacium glaucopus]
MPYVHPLIRYASDQQARPLATNPSASCTNDAVMMAKDKFETTKWTASDIQASIHKGLDLLNPQAAPKLVRIYVDGSFDVFDVGHALQLGQAKVAFSFVHLIVGVFSDEVLLQNGYAFDWSSPIASDRSTGTHPVNARMGAVDNSDTGKKRKKPYYRHQSGPSQTRGQRRGKEDLSEYTIPVMELRSVTAGSSNTPAVIAPPIASTSGATPATAETRRRGYTGNTKTKVRRRPVYDDNSDVHRVSSGSDTY